MSTEQNIEASSVINGVDTDQVLNLAGLIQQHENYGKFCFKAKNGKI